MAALTRKPGDASPWPLDDSRQLLDWLSWDVGLAEGASGTSAATSAVQPDAFGPELAVVPSSTTDSMIGQQWHLTAINVFSVWGEFTGKGVKIGFIDDGFDYNQKDLKPNYDLANDYDARQKDNDAFCSTTSDKHGTTTSGTAAGAEGGGNVVGVAFEATIEGYRMGFGSAGSNAQILDDMQRQTAVDISNNSWGFSGFFSDNFGSSSFSAIGQAMAYDAMHGRGDLGTIFVFAAGNDRTSGQDVNYHNFQNSKYVIAAGALNQDGTYAYFSDPGAALLVSAPGVNIVTDDRTGTAGYAKTDYATVSGTSYSAPIVSGLVALMLDANPNLGARDVQEILAYSSKNPLATDSTYTGWQINGADNWNGGGLHFSHDYGFGLVDAHAAVRLAETWGAPDTWNNVLTEGGSLSNLKLAIPDNNTTGISSTISINQAPLDIDRIDVAVNISHTWIGDLIVTLASPDGTVSTLVNRPGVSSTSSTGSSQDNIVFTLDTVADWGENSQGSWTLTVKDVHSGSTGTLNSWSISLYGDAASANDQYVYTDEFGRYAATDATRQTLADANGGTDTINLAAVTGDVSLDMRDGHTSTVAGTTLTIAAGTFIENAFLGDGNDTVIGNDLANVINGGRGNDAITGGGGGDTITGGAGADTIVFTAITDAGDVVTDYAIGQDHLNLSGLLASIGYNGTDPLAAYIQESASADLAIYVDADGAGAGGQVLLVTLIGVTTTLTIGTDILVA